MKIFLKVGRCSFLSYWIIEARWGFTLNDDGMIFF